MNIELILDAAEAGAPGLRELARRFPEAETRHLGVPLEHLAATEPDPLNNGSAFMALARTGAQAIVTRIKTEAASQHVC